MEDILAEHRERIERLERIERAAAAQEASQPQGACLHVILRLGDSDDCVCVKCSTHMTTAAAQDYLDSLPWPDKQKSLLERLQDADKG